MVWINIVTDYPYKMYYRYSYCCYSYYNNDNYYYVRLQVPPLLLLLLLLLVPVDEDKQNLDESCDTRRNSTLL
jgi:hypothetical protein